MKKLIFLIIILLAGLAPYSAAYPAVTDPSALDQYAGDTAIYGASTATIQPNVLIIFDNSGSMSGNAAAGQAYNKATTYTVTNSCEGDTQPCDSAWVYRLVAFGVEGKWVKWYALSGVTNKTTSPTNKCKDTLTNTGQYKGMLSGSNGQCGTGTNGTYATGNWINWLNASGTQAYPKIEVAKKVVRDLIIHTSGVKFGLMLFNEAQGGYVAYPVSDMTQSACSGANCDYLDENATAVAVGTNQKTILDTIGDPGQDLASSTLYNDLYSYADDNPLGIQPSTWTPLAETLYEAMLYYSAKPTKFGPPGTYTTPIEYSCQKNYVILITDGMSTKDDDIVLKSICNNGDCDGDGFEPANDPAKAPYDMGGSDYLDDVAWYMYNKDLLTDNPADAKTIGKQNVITYTIGFGLTGGDAGAVKLLSEAAQNGGGQAYLASDITGLSNALVKIFANIMADNTSFVAPVVPVSPENKVFSGERVYIGFFKPSITGFWSGNLKKYGLKANNNTLQITDKDGNPATNLDGSFKDNSISFWSTTVDGGNVEAGGVGIQLLNRTSARNIYTYLGNAAITDTSNAFTTANANITTTMLGVGDSTERDKLIRYVYGEDSYNNSTNKRGWILGDILHSRPQVVQYAKFSMSNEASCTANKTIIYVGGNDGMLHAYKDCNGEELWAFIPPDKLGHLRYLNGPKHTYYVDGTSKAYIFDKNKDGSISATDDKVILIFGERRGGQYYYALDVTDPNTPKFMWRIGYDGLIKAGSTTVVTGSDTWFTELWETWSDPIIAKMKIGSAKKMAMFIGGGYDNNQDLEPLAIASADLKGRAVYAVEIADISSAAPSFTNSGNKLWGYTNANNSSMTHSIPSTVSIIDVNDDTYIDRVYVGDTNGRMWRLDVKGDTPTWTGKLLFSSNSTTSEKRKIFYEPAITLEVDKNNNPFEMLFFGTGDREHPIRTNTNNTENPGQVDRMYAVKDKGKAYTITETYLTDVTDDTLQASQTPSQINCLLSKLGWQMTGITGCDEQDGWYIKLDLNTEEKVLASTTVFNKGAYFTTYSPNAETSTDVCTTGNRGTARVYAVHWRTGEAILNFDTTNDATTTTNARAKDSQNKILLRSDRVQTLGSGIPSQLIVVIMPGSGGGGGGVFGLVGVGGAIVTPGVKSEELVQRIYWRELF